MKEVWEKARLFLYRHARPLELARYQYHFEGGTREAVLNALAAYQNPDGGFGHALEPDSWNPHSTPIQTWAATEILREIELRDAGHPIVQGMIRYLLSGADFDGHCWANAVNTNNNYPCAPWWRVNVVSTCHATYNPGASLAGFLLRYGEKGGTAYALGLRVAREAYAAKLARGTLDDMHESACYLQLLEDARTAGIQSAPDFDLEKLAEDLRGQVRHCIVKDRADWENAYICRPSQFMKDRESEFYQENAEMAEYECEFLERTQLPDGSWPIPWNWDAHPEEWAVSKMWWKGSEVVKNLLYLQGMGKQ